jgi:hypothetical protein
MIVLPDSAARPAAGRSERYSISAACGAPPGCRAVLDQPTPAAFPNLFAIPGALRTGAAGWAPELSAALREGQRGGHLGLSCGVDGFQTMGLKRVKRRLTVAFRQAEAEGLTSDRPGRAARMPHGGEHEL